MAADIYTPEAGGDRVAGDSIAHTYNRQGKVRTEERFPLFLLARFRRSPPDVRGKLMGGQFTVEANEGPDGSDTLELDCRTRVVDGKIGTYGCAI